MDYNSLLELATTVAHRLAMSGAETFRVEDTVLLIMQAYGVEAETFAIPNCLTVSIETPEGIPMTRMKRIGYHGNDLDCVERYSNLSRRICREKPNPVLALQWLKEADQVKRKFPLPVHLVGSFLGACGYSIFFGGSLADSLFAGICGIVVGLVNMLMDRLKANAFFRTIIASFLMAVLAYGLSVLGIVKNADTVIIGTLMILVPGLLFTNALRDIIYGDTNSGLNRIVTVFMIAVAIALGTGAALQVISSTIAESVAESVKGEGRDDAKGSIVCRDGRQMMVGLWNSVSAHGQLVQGVDGVEGHLVGLWVAKGKGYALSQSKRLLGKGQKIRFSLDGIVEENRLGIPKFIAFRQMLDERRVPRLLFFLKNAATAGK